MVRRILRSLFRYASISRSAMLVSGDFASLYRASHVVDVSSLSPQSYDRLLAFIASNDKDIVLMCSYASQQDKFVLLFEGLYIELGASAVAELLSQSAAARL